MKNQLYQLPTEIWLNILDILPSHDASNVCECIPHLKSFSSSRAIIVSFVKEGEAGVSQRFLERRITTNVCYVKLPIKEASEFRCDLKKQQVKKAITEEIQRIKDYILSGKTTIENPEIILEFAFDVDSPSIYNTMELYPLIYPHFRKIPHSVEILKLERNLLDFSKSRNGNLTLFDCFAPLYEVDNYNHLSRESKDLKVKLHAGIFHMNNSIEEDMTRSICFFQDIDDEVRQEILNLKDSYLKEINLVLPFQQNSDKLYFHTEDPEMKKLHEISAFQASIRFQHEYYAYFKKVLAPAQVPLTQSILDALNDVNYKFDTMVVDERPEENRWMSLRKSYELLYRMFKNDHWIDEDSTDPEERRKCLEIIHEYFVISVSRKYQFYINKKKDVSDPEFLKLTLLQHTQRDDDRDEITNVYKNIKGSHSLPCLRAFSDLLP